MSSVSSPAISSTSPTSLPSAASTFQPTRIISHETGSPTSTVLPLALLTAPLARIGPRTLACPRRPNQKRKRVAFPPEGDMNERPPQVSRDSQQQVDRGCSREAGRIRVEVK